jgi:uncharacterized membrane protein
MLARRFTIVCLLMTVFGMGLAILVAQEGRTEHSRLGANCLIDARAWCPNDYR